METGNKNMLTDNTIYNVEEISSYNLVMPQDTFELIPIALGK